MSMAGTRGLIISGSRDSSVYGQDHDEGGWPILPWACRMTRGSTAHIAVVVLATLVLGACLLDRGTAPGSTVVRATPIPTFTPSLRPTPTPTPITNLSRTGAELLVWRQISSCADQVALSTQTRAEVAFVSTYEAEQMSWVVKASSEDLGLTFGLWEVSDGTSLVAPMDEVARDIASPGILCERPSASLAMGATPPLISAPTPTPTSTPTPIPTPKTNLSQTSAELRVWWQVNPCVDQVARSTQIRAEVAFVSTYDVERRAWLVEASSKALGLTFGLWEVSDTIRLVTPVDEVASNVVFPDIVCDQPRTFLATGATPPLFSAPTQDPLVATGDEARLRVWLAVYGCFDPAPPFESFSAYRHVPERWIVEGRGGSTTAEEGPTIVTYGLWTVNADTGDIVPYDVIATELVAP